MASSSSSSALCLIFFSFLLSLLSLSLARPHALVLPVKKDRYTRQYVTRVNARTPLVPLSLVVDLGGRYLWVDCESNYVSSSYRPVRCNSPQCSLVNSTADCRDCPPPYSPGCNKQSCSVTTEFKKAGTAGELAQDAFAFQSTDGRNPGPIVKTSEFIFSCVPHFSLEGLARSANGLMGLGRNRIAMPIQLAVEFRLRPKFAICLASSTASDGVIFFGDGPYNFLPNLDASQGLIYTPLITNNVSTATWNVVGERSVEHFIGVKSIKINEKVVPLNASLLSINKQGFGGTKISTVAPYTVLETSIYNAVTDAFAAALSEVKRVAAVAPFKLCYGAKDLGSTRVGPGVPAIDLVLQSESVYWRIFGANSMVEAKAGVLCLGFVDGGVNPMTGLFPMTSIVIGGHQIEDNLLQFDLKKRMLGFSSSLLFRQTTCGNFNFTANP